MGRRGTSPFFYRTFFCRINGENEMKDIILELVAKAMIVFGVVGIVWALLEKMK